jgi:hypothetical protein
MLKQPKPSSSYLYRPWLVGLLVSLLILHWILVSIDVYSNSAALTHLTPWFDLDREHNIPTTISSLLFLAAGYWCVRMFLVSRYKIQKLGCLALTTLLVYFALDEFLIIHEQFAEPLRRLLHISGSSPLFHAWVIPGFFAASVLGVAIVVIQKHKSKLIVFLPLLVRVCILALGSVLWEVVGTYVYSNQLAYRFAMVPVEEMFEFTMASLIGLQAYRTYKTLEPLSKSRSVK